MDDSEIARYLASYLWDNMSGWYDDDRGQFLIETSATEIEKLIKSFYATLP
jgi:hypothetical protein